jgi:hypothetical protein
LNDYNSTNSTTFILTYGYNITLTLNPSSTHPGVDVVASGNVIKDDGSSVPETTVSLAIPSDNVIVPLTDGDYAYTFDAPAVGTYNVTASIISLENGVTYIKTAPLTVTAGNNGNNGNNNGGGDYSIYGQYFGDTGDNDGGDDGESGYVIEDSEPEEVTETPVDDGDNGHGNDDDGYDESNPGNSEGSQGVGKASGFFSLENLTSYRLPWIILALVVLVITLYMMGRKGKEIEDDHMGLNSYLEKRLNQDNKDKKE